MAVPESELPGKGKRPGMVASGNRPLASGPGGPAGSGYRPPANALSNRPILLKPRSAGDLPDADDEDDEDEEENDLKEVLRNAPAWLVSTVFHMMLLIILGVVVFTAQKKSADVQIEISTTDPGMQLEDDAALDAASTKIETAQEQIITPQDLPPVDDPLAAPPELVDLNLTARPTLASGPATDGAPIGLALKGRQVGSKNALLKQYGGTGATEGAVELGLEWLARQQKSDGSWSLRGPYVDGSTGENVVAATAMALLAFQGHGDTHQEGKWAKVVSRGWEALRKMQGQDGLFKGAMGEKNQLLYAHAQATIALCELYGMTKDSRFRPLAERAVEYCIFAQDKKQGGWRYEPGVDSDTSVTGWFVMALQSARMAGLKVPDEVLKRVMMYLDSAALDGGRRYAYWSGQQPSSALSAEGLLCRQYLGWAQNEPRLVEGISSLVSKSPIKYDLGVDHDVYYWYYATQVAHHMEGKIWEEWNANMRSVVPQKQIKTGAEAGSWDPQGDKWADFNGRLYMTCLSIYMLEVYYRHLPIYSGYKWVAPATPPQTETKPETPAADKPNPPKATTTDAKSN